MLYFAAASYSETARRLGKHHLAPSFLLHDNPSFGPAAQRACERATHIRSDADTSQFSTEISQIVAPFNIAGLADPRRHNWYPVDANDLLNSAEKVDSTTEETTQLLEKCGFWKSDHATT
jgi:FADH2 O2-dependent halogenase